MTNDIPLTLTSLPDDILYTLIKNLELESLIHFGQTSKKLNGLVNQEDLIKAALLKTLEYGDGSSTFKNLINDSRVKPYLPVDSLSNEEIFIFIAKKLIKDGLLIKNINFYKNDSLDDETLKKIIDECHQKLDGLSLCSCAKLSKFSIPSESSIKEINLSGSTVECFSVGENSAIENLKCTNCKELKTATIYNNSKIKALNIAGNKLKTFFLGENSQIKELVLSGCTELKEITISNDSKIGEFSLIRSSVKNLTIGKNCEIKLLNLSAAKNLTSLTIPAGTKIKTLKFDASELQTLILQEGCELFGKTITSIEQIPAELKRSRLQIIIEPRLEKPNSSIIPRRDINVSTKFATSPAHLQQESQFL